MKTEEEIKKMSDELKDALVDAVGENIVAIQGFIRALNWVVTDEKPQDGFSD